MRGCLAAFAGLFVAIAGAAPASAWTRPGHMVTAEIAWREIAARRPDLLEPIGKLLDAHPDRGPFQVAIDRTTGLEKARRLFLECARWPDDIRETGYDQPSWHAALRPVAMDGVALPHGEAPVGDAVEAFALNYHTLANARASNVERAKAMCWVLHLAGDIHQPLHTAELFSRAYPNGDGGGGRQFVRDPLADGTISLHWMWDDSINRSGAVADVSSRTDAILAQYPRKALPELRMPTAASQFESWARTESYPLARSLAFDPKVGASPQPETVTPIPETLWRDIRTAAEKRVAIAGYRMADLVIAAFGEAAR